MKYTLPLLQICASVNENTFYVYSSALNGEFGNHISLLILIEVSSVPAHMKPSRYAAVPLATEDCVPQSLYWTDCIGQALHPGTHFTINSGKTDGQVDSSVMSLTYHNIGCIDVVCAFPTQG